MIVARVDSVMASGADRQGFPPTRREDFLPLSFRPPSWPIEVGEFAEVVHLHRASRPTQRALFREYVLDDF